MTSAVEAGAKVASGVVDGLKSQPLSLALIVMNVVFVVFVAWLAHTVNTRTEHQYEVKDALINTVIGKLEASIVELRNEVKVNTDRSAANSVTAVQIADAVSRVVRMQEDQEKRLRDLERARP